MGYWREIDPLQSVNVNESRAISKQRYKKKENIMYMRSIYIYISFLLFFSYLWLFAPFLSLCVCMSVDLSNNSTCIQYKMSRMRRCDFPSGLLLCALFNINDNNKHTQLSVLCRRFICTCHICA